jgi:hypothetical protein
MRFWRRGGRQMTTMLIEADTAFEAGEADEAVFECTGVLVAHADGTLECDDAHECGTDEAVHGWWVPCTELGCGCTGDEGDLVVLFPPRAAEEAVLLAA